LRQVVDGRPCVGEVAEEVADTPAKRLRHRVLVGRRHRDQDGLVDVFVEVEDLAVPGFPWIQALTRTAAGITNRRAARKQHDQDSHDGSPPTHAGNLQIHLFPPLAAGAGAAGAGVEPASAALLNRN
jgi:hypothetical protein